MPRGKLPIFTFNLPYRGLTILFNLKTKGRTQSELDEMYEKKIQPRKFSGYVTELQNARKLV